MQASDEKIENKENHQPGDIVRCSTKFSELTQREVKETLYGELRSMGVLQLTSDMAQH